MEVSENVAKQIQEYNCKAIFLKGNKNNQIGIRGEGRFATNLTVLLEDLNSSAHELQKTFYAYGKSSDSIYKTPIGELPHLGVKRFIGEPAISSINKFYSSNIIVADNHEVALYGKSKTL